MKTSYPYKLYSHPEVLLKDHLEWVKSYGLGTFDRNGYFTEYRLCLKTILLFHDLGKASSFFQEYLRGERERSLKTAHSEISAIWAFSYLYKCKHVGAEQALLAYIAIKHHHDNLKNYSHMFIPTLEPDSLIEISDAIDYNELNEIYQLNETLTHEKFLENLEALKTCSLHRISRRKLQGGMKNWMILNYLFSLLVWSDKQAAIFGYDESILNKDRNWKPTYVDSYREGLPVTSLSDQRNSFFNALSKIKYLDEKIHGISLPTGYGKTISSLKYALKLREKLPTHHRIVYCLPFISVIDQNYEVFRKILEASLSNIDSTMLLPHHSLSDGSYSVSEYTYEQDKGEFFIESWNSEIVVTTFVQLLNTFLSNKNKHLKRFNVLANSIVILDEVQSIPHKYWLLIKECLNLLAKELNLYVLLVTATMPLIFDASKNEIVNVVESNVLTSELPNRTEINLEYIEETMTVEDLAEIVKTDYQGSPNLNRLVIVNTIRSSIELYNSLASEIPNNKIVYLSAGIVPKTRLERINFIKENRDKGLVIVSTQVVEAGVDIDVDVVYRDIAPLDSLIQAAGRCNRNNNLAHKGVLFVVNLHNGRNSFWSYIYDRVLIHATLNILKNSQSPIVEGRYNELITQYYQTLSNVVADESSKHILNEMSNLNYEKAFCYSREEKEAFHLFDDIESITAFIEIDPDASELLKEYRSLNDVQYDDIFQRRAHLKRLLVRMSHYMINVPKNILNDEGDLFVIDKDMLHTMYRMETGFIRDPQIEDFIL